MPAKEAGSPVASVDRILVLTRESANRMRLLCAIGTSLVLALLGLQTVAILSNPTVPKNVPGLVVQVAMGVFVLVVVILQWWSQNRNVRAISVTAEQLREDEERNRIAGLTVAEGLISADGRGNITYFNYTSERIFGYKDGEVHGKSLTMLMPERFRARHLAGFEAYLKSGLSQIFDGPVELVGLRSNGEEFPIDLSIAHVKQDEFNFFSAVVRDITKRRRAEDDLRSAEERFRLLIQNVRDYAIISLDPTGHITTWNEGAERIKGYTADEIIGQHFSKFYTSEDMEAGKPEMELRVATSEGRFEDLGWRVRKDGSRFFANVVLTALLDEKGNLRGFAKVTRDITERKRIEDENVRLTEGLEHRNAELLASNKELEAFTYSVAHDLRSPLRHISGFAKILAEEYGPTMEPEARDYLTDIQQGSARMGALIDDLLNLAKLSRQEVNFQITGLSGIVDNVLKTLEAETRNREITWRVDDLPFVECDPSLITQVYANLLSNAVKYTRPRKQAVIEIGKMQVDGEMVLFVKDNGVGFNMTYADKLFGVFQRLHRAEDFEGTGVGLATVQRILHKHGGRIWVEAELDKGASFYFTIGSATDKPVADSIAPTTFKHADTVLVQSSHPPTQPTLSESSRAADTLLNGNDAEEIDMPSRERNSLNV